MRVRIAPVSMLLVAACAACAPGHVVDPGDPPDAGEPADDPADAGEPPDGARDAGDLDGGTPGTDAGIDAGPGDAGVVDGPPPSALPIVFARPDDGPPLTPAELTTATDELIGLLRETRYFDFVDERAHGWPESDPTHAYWYATWWSGVSVTKTAGVVTYQHGPSGSDNNGIHTSPYLEGACFAHLMWGEASTAHLVRRLTRGFNGWRLATVRNVGDTNPPLLARAFYPTSVDSTDAGRALHIDYNLNRPGIDAAPSAYVHIADNPTFGDVYVKNKRSKDDIGHMLRAIIEVQACAPRLDADGQEDLRELLSLYRAWAARVDAEGSVIETLDTDGNLTTPPDALAHYTLTGNLECLGALSLRLVGGSPPGDLDCGDGLSTLESIGWKLVKNDARQIIRTHHTAALVAAYLQGDDAVALSLVSGLARRVELDLSIVEGASPPADFTVEDVASELIYASNAGVPLTSHEVRWLHTRLHEAYVGMRDPSQSTTFHVFDATTPDGNYPFDAPTVGLFHRDVGMLLGACASIYRNPSARPMFDCERLRAAF